MGRTSVIVAITACLLALVSVRQAQGDGPTRDTVREVKYHAGVTVALKAIEEEACQDYKATGEFKIFQERRNPQPGDVRTENFGYSCPHPDNDRGGWMYLPAISGDLSSLVSATEQATDNGASHPKAGQVILDKVFTRGQQYFDRTIFPAYLPDDPSLEYKFWTYNHQKKNPLRMQIYQYGEHDPGPECPQGLRLETLHEQPICYRAADHPPTETTQTLLWQGDTVFENYLRTATKTKQVEMDDHTPVMVNAPDPAQITEDHWTYQQ